MLVEFLCPEGDLKKFVVIYCPQNGGRLVSNVLSGRCLCRGSGQFLLHLAVGENDDTEEAQLVWKDL